MNISLIIPYTYNYTATLETFRSVSFSVTIYLYIFIIIYPRMFGGVLATASKAIIMHARAYARAYIYLTGWQP